MLLSTETRAIATSGVAPAAFTIAANGKAFRVMIDGLYSDKEWAIVRELSTNAYDSHIMAGTQATPFEIHCPVTYEPWFSVRDFGTGISPDYMLTGYTQVFHSTKDDSNTQVGAFGLGRMTPFAKTDTYTVTSWFEGVKRVYSVFLNEQRIPAIAMLAEEVSSDPSGVEVQIAVAPRDFSAFETAIKTAVSLGFPVAPTVTGREILPPTLVVALEGTGWRIIDRRTTGFYNRRAYAIQGCVAYPIDAAVIDNLSDSERALLAEPLIIDFKIGDLEVTASRESISYDERTKAAIKARVAEIAAEYSLPFEKEVAAAPTMWAAWRKAWDLTAGLAVLGDLVRKSLRWRGRALKPQITINNEITRYERNPILGHGLRASFVHGGDLSRGRFGGRRTTIKWEPSSRVVVAPNDTVVLFEDVDDNLHNPGLRIRYWADQANRNTSVLWLKGRRGDYALKRMLVKLGRPQVVDLATLPKPPRGVSTIHRTKTRMKVFDEKRKTWEEADLIEEDDHIYINLSRGTAIFQEIGDREISVDVSQIRDTLARMRLFGLLEPNARLVGVPATHKRVPIRNKGTWTELRTIVDEALKTFDPVKYATALGYKELRDEKSVVTELMKALQLDGSVVPSDGPMARFQTLWTRADEKVKAAKTQFDLAMLRRTAYLQGDPDVPPVMLRLWEKKTDEIMNAYPLLKAVNFNRGDVSALLHYVKLVDEATKQDHLSSSQAIENPSQTVSTEVALAA